MEDDIRKPVVYLDLRADGKKKPVDKHLSGRTSEEAASLEDRLAFWLDLLDR